MTPEDGAASGGPPRVSFSRFMETALYEPSTGFYAGAGRAGRRADFLTSPEVGPLFGVLVARWLDDTWRSLGRPDPFVVVEWGAGPGTLARAVRVVGPECAHALRYVLVERSATQRALHVGHLPGWAGDLDRAAIEEFATSRGNGPRFASSTDGPEGFIGAVVANELLDNLPFDIVRHNGAGRFERLDVVEGDGGAEFAAGPVELSDEVRRLLASAPAGEWMPLQAEARSWVARAVASLATGRVLVIDYGSPTAELAARPSMGWLRTYADQAHGGHPLDEPGSRDITADVAIDQVQLDHRAASVTTQREWASALGIDGLVEEGRRLWAERAQTADLAAIRGRSRVREAEALTEAGGLGDFVVLEWRVPGGPTH